MANNCTAHLWRGGNLSLDKTEGGMAEDGLMPILIFLCVLRLNHVTAECTKVQFCISSSLLSDFCIPQQLLCIADSRPESSFTRWLPYCYRRSNVEPDQLTCSNVVM